MQPYDANLLHKALKLHFTTESYDFFRYCGKVKDSRAQQEKFLQNKQRFFYAQIARHQDPQGLIVANLLIDPKMFVADIVSPEALANYADWKGRQSQLTYLLNKQLSDHDNFRHIIKIDDTGLPFLISEMIGGRISPEVVIMLDTFSKRLDKWADIDHPLMQKVQLRLRKYRPFVKFDKERVKAVLQNLIQPAL